MLYLCLLQCIRSNADHRRVLIWRTQHAITFQVDGINDHSPKIQVSTECL